MAFYGGLTATSVTGSKGVIAPYLTGADEDLVHEFLAESELDVRNEIGDLPIGSEGSPDLIVRAVIRDLAAARTILKLVGSDNDEGRRAGQALEEYAWNRLRRRQEFYSDNSGDPVTGMVHNVFPEPLFNDPKSPRERRLGSEWLT